MQVYGGSKESVLGREGMWYAMEDSEIILNTDDTSLATEQAYGGSKESGLGREGVRYAMEDYVEIRTLLLSSPGVSI